MFHNKPGSNIIKWFNNRYYHNNIWGNPNFQVHSSHMKPKCVSLTNSLFELDKDQNCFEDEQGKCQIQVKFNKSETAENYKKELYKRFIGSRKRRNVYP
mgnify:CR=1 FL=1